MRNAAKNVNDYHLREKLKLANPEEVKRQQLPKASR